MDKNRKVEFTLEELSKLVAHFCQLSLENTHSMKMPPEFTFGMQKALLNDFTRDRETDIADEFKKDIVLFDLEMLSEDAESAYNTKLKSKMDSVNDDKEDPLKDFYNDDED